MDLLDDVRIRTSPDVSHHLVEIPIVRSFESTGIMDPILRMVCRFEFFVNNSPATLHTAAHVTTLTPSHVAQAGRRTHTL